MISLLFINLVFFSYERSAFPTMATYIEIAKISALDFGNLVCAQGSGGGSPQRRRRAKCVSGDSGAKPPPRENVGISRFYNCKLFAVGSNIGGILARRKRMFSP